MNYISLKGLETSSGNRKKEKAEYSGENFKLIWTKSKVKGNKEITLKLQDKVTYSMSFESLKTRDLVKVIGKLIKMEKMQNEHKMIKRLHDEFKQFNCSLYVKFLGEFISGECSYQNWNLIEIRKKTEKFDIIRKKNSLIYKDKNLSIEEDKKGKLLNLSVAGKIKCYTDSDMEVIRKEGRKLWKSYKIEEVE